MERQSFRDPQGRTWLGPEGVTRGAWTEERGTEAGSLETMLAEMQEAGQWVAAKALDPSLLEGLLGPNGPRPKRAWIHPRVFFPSYAHEWSPSMLRAAAALTLEINEKLLAGGWELKDATPTNILFEGPRPLFVDHLSPSKRKPGQMGWSAYGQFTRTFLIPLCLHRLKSLPLAWIHLARRDGIAPEEAIPLLGLFDRFRPTILFMITLPAFLSGRKAKVPARGLNCWKGGDESIGREITARLLKGLKRQLNRWAPAFIGRTVWSEYDLAGESYTPRGLEAKHAFIQSALVACRPKAVLDLGCNTGRYAKLAALSGARVVAVDGDPLCIDRLWREAQGRCLDIQPLVIDLGRPSPALGWENAEEIPFLERTQGRFDMVFALALIHHLLVRERIPLARIISHLAERTTKWAILEWVPRNDPQFLRLEGPDAGLYSHLDRSHFEAALGGTFRILDFAEIPDGSRVIYLLQREK